MSRGKCHGVDRDIQIKIDLDKRRERQWSTERIRTLFTNDSRMIHGLIQEA